MPSLMASSAILHFSPSSSLLLSRKICRPSVFTAAQFPRSLTIKASTSLDYSNVSVIDKSAAPSKTNNWKWKFEDNSINIYYEEYEKESSDPPKDILMIPTISDVSTVEEWRLVARDIVQRVGKVNWRATIIDWPGLGYSDRPKIDYNADVLEKFLVDFMSAPDCPISQTRSYFRPSSSSSSSLDSSSSSSSGSEEDFGTPWTVVLIKWVRNLATPLVLFCFHFWVGNAHFCRTPWTVWIKVFEVRQHFLFSFDVLMLENDLVVFGGGHAATITIRAAKKGLVKPAAIAAVAPTWAGPLPIVFGRDSDMETRYGLLRGTLRAPAVGWMMYNMLVSNEKAIQSQYKSHVYADPNNVTPSIVESRYALTKRKGARYVPAAFLTGLLDPVNSREEFLELFAALEGQIPVLVVSTKGSPKRSKAEMEALRGAKGVSKFVELPGALLPQEEYPPLLQRSFTGSCKRILNAKRKNSFNGS
ncbi:hypothetical protein CK203_087256 [Vitis vinifera]|uniref:AB hydrolase-1 domain-containing protein n=1 Tax=Vitis vinifera TaxID=29760 RepID=A0A438BM67_VITVI|nr:hypothetical protein CK203_087256 [Vitis vinifera]